MSISISISISTTTTIRKSLKCVRSHFGSSIVSPYVHIDHSLATQTLQSVKL